ncbi:hypothetical protein L6R52_11010 [Myxococcota bacterium]|nr:hypothetical protein [Myxococcota bacterium]
MSERFSSRVLYLAPLCLSVVTGCPDETEPFTPWTLETLAASEGFSLRIPEFDVPAGAEIQDCYFVQVPDLGGGEDVWVQRRGGRLGAPRAHGDQPGQPPHERVPRADDRRARPGER